MVVTIDLNDANNDGIGINMPGYLSDIDTSFQRADYGYFSHIPNDYAGNTYATADVANALLTGNPAAWALVAESGPNGDFSYNLATNTLNGTLDGFCFGYGLSYDISSDTISHIADDIEIFGLNLSGSGAGNPVHTLIYDLMSGNIAELEAELNSNDLVINGSTGDDVLQSYAGNDILTGGAGDDVFRFDNLSGNDVITDLQPGDTIDILWQGVTDFADLIIDYASDAGNAIVSAAGVADTITVEGFSTGLDDTYFV